MSGVASEFEAFRDAIEGLLKQARALPEKWQRSIRRAVRDSRDSGVPLDEIAPDLAAEPLPEPPLPVGYDMARVHPDIKDRLCARAVAVSILSQLDQADAEVPPEQVAELVQLVADGLPDD